MAEAFYGQSPISLTVSASPTPTAAQFTVSDDTDLIAEQFILVKVGGDFERTKIESKPGSNVLNVNTGTYALTGAPDTPGEVRSSRSLILTSTENLKGVFNADDVADLQTVDTTYAPNGLKYTTRDTGTVYGLNSSASSGGITPNTGPGRWFPLTRGEIIVTHLEKLALTPYEGMRIFNTDTGLPEYYINGRFFAPSVARQDYDVSGTVTNAFDASPIEGAVVTVNGNQTDTTDASGNYSISDVPKGAAVSISATADGYQDYTGETVDISSGNATKNFTMSRGSIYGVVTSSDGSTPIEGADVSIASPARSDTTNASGEYTLDDVPPGDYTVEGTATNHSAYSSPSTVEVDGDTEFDFEMTLSAGTVSGTVTSDETSEPVLAGLGVTIGGVGPENTDSNGDYSIDDVPTGSQSVAVADSTYYNSFSDSVTVDEADEEYNFQLTPKEVPCTDESFGLSASDYSNTKGNAFTPSRDCKIVAIRIYTSDYNTSTRTVKVWTDGGSLLGSGSDGTEFAPGWNTIYLSSPVSLTASTTYRVSVHQPGWIGTTTSQIDSSHAYAPYANGGNSYQASGDNFPNTGTSGTQYAVDPVIVL